MEGGVRIGDSVFAKIKIKISIRNAAAGNERRKSIRIARAQKNTVELKNPEGFGPCSTQLVGSLDLMGVLLAEKIIWPINYDLLSLMTEIVLQSGQRQANLPKLTFLRLYSALQKEILSKEKRRCQGFTLHFQPSPAPQATPSLASLASLNSYITI